LRLGDVQIVLPECEAVRSVEVVEHLLSSRGLVDTNRVDRSGVPGRATGAHRRGGRVGAAVGQQDVAVGALQHEARLVEALSPHVDRKTLRDM
jgi:hypothetical protein